MSIDQTVRQTLLEHRMEADCSGLILGVSGGPDSMAMLSWYLSEPRPYPLTVAHVNHGLRKESDAEEAMVSSFCDRAKVPCFVLHTDVAAARQQGETVESAARRLRYDFFFALAKQRGASHLATAHTLDDQSETVLLHLLHGAGPRGLCGILPLRSERGVTVIRPFLEVTKEQILSYCVEQSVPFSVDSTNADLRFTRNRIRHRILPAMEKVNPEVKQAICRTATALQRQQRHFEALAEAFLQEHPDGLPADLLRKRSEGEQTEILRALFLRQGKVLTSAQTKQALELLSKETGTAEFDRRYVLHLGQNRLTVYQRFENLPTVTLSEESALLPDGRSLRLVRCTATEENRTALIPASLPLTLRSRKVGDRLTLAGGTRSLKKRMIDLKIPVEHRNRLWVIAQGEEVLWCEKLGCNRNFSPTPGDDGYFIELSEQ